MKTNVENNTGEFKSAEQQQQDAWVAVYNTLCEVAPELMYGSSKTGRETACDAVRTLTIKVKEQEAQIESMSRVLHSYDNDF